MNHLTHLLYFLFSFYFSFCLYESPVLGLFRAALEGTTALGFVVDYYSFIVGVFVASPMIVAYLCSTLDPVYWNWLVRCIFYWDICINLTSMNY